MNTIQPHKNLANANTQKPSSTESGRLSIGLCTFLAGLLLMSNGCTSLKRNISNLMFPPNPHSDRRDGESVTLEVLYLKDRSSPDFQFPSTVDKAAFPVAAVAGFIVDQTVQFLKDEGDRYSATYSAAAFGDTFYDGWNKEAAINTRAIRLSRKVKGEPAMQFCALVEPTLDERAFHLIPVSLSVNLAKAKLIGFDWLAPLNFDLLAPWTIFKNEWAGFDNNVDVKIELALEAIWLHEEANSKTAIHQEQVAKQEFSFQNVTLGQSGTIDPFGLRNWTFDTTTNTLIKKPNGDGKSGQPTPSDLCNTHLDRLTRIMAPKEYVFTPPGTKLTPEEITLGEEIKNALMSGAKVTSPIFPAIPRTRVSTTNYGPGNFILKALVTEHDNFGERVKELGNKLEGKKEGIVNKVSGWFD